MRSSPLFRAFVVAGVAVTLSASALAPAYGAAAATTTTAPTTTAPKWVKSVCTSIGDWLDTLDDAATTTTAGTVTSPQAGKKKLTKVVGQAAAATDALVADLEKAGAPDVPDGKNLASILRQQYRQLSKSLKGALKTLKKTDASDPATFGVAARSVEDALESAFEQSQAAFNAAGLLDAPALVDAFLAQKACAGITSS